MIAYSLAIYSYLYMVKDMILILPSDQVYLCTQILDFLDEKQDISLLEKWCVIIS